MKIDEAIEILTMATGEGGLATHDDYIAAQKLGIEALKYFKAERQRRGAAKTMWLPGETVEKE